jgi:hypothetical protein
VLDLPFAAAVQPASANVMRWFRVGGMCRASEDSGKGDGQGGERGRRRKEGDLGERERERAGMCTRGI